MGKAGKKAADSLRANLYTSADQYKKYNRVRQARETFD
jgi:hypothetical protein